MKGIAVCARSPRSRERQFALISLAKELCERRKSSPERDISADSRRRLQTVAANVSSR